jgi:hypothetical protein
MTRAEFFKLIQDILVAFDNSTATPGDVPNVMNAVQIVLQQEKKTSTVVVNRV